MTEFAMVEELAFLIKDNLPCKHLVLSVEEALINFLHDDSSLDGVLELEPMNPYNRLLLHRLADIFGFAHESVGEGDDRHLILERCPETSIPSILVSDILWQYDEFQSPVMSHQLLKRTEATSVLKTKPSSFQHSLEEREAAYMAARERIFSTDVGKTSEKVNPKPRNVPVVARRMIAHALGQRISPCNQEVTPSKNEEGEFEKLSIQDKDKIEAHCKNANLQSETKGSYPDNSEKSAAQKREERKPTSNGDIGISQTARLKEEHVGAAKRMFAHALRLHSPKDGSLRIQ